MNTQDFEAQLKAENFDPGVTISKPVGYSMDEHAHPFEAWALIVEGDISMTGNSVLVYDNTSLNVDPYKLPSKARFARVPGSWLDKQQGF